MDQEYDTVATPNDFKDFDAWIKWAKVEAEKHEPVEKDKTGQELPF